jgi:hypothetical protein
MLPLGQNMQVVLDADLAFHAGCVPGAVFKNGVIA